jgi:hypothetical protein
MGLEVLEEVVSQGAIVEANKVEVIGPSVLVRLTTGATPRKQNKNSKN